MATAAATEKREAKERARGTIRDQGYQRYTGEYLPESGRWWLITRRMLRMAARQPWVTAMLIVAILPALGWGIVVWLASKTAAMMAAAAAQAAAQGGAPPPGMGAPPSADHLILGVSIEPYGTLLVAFLTALFAGGGAIADDARGGASQFYFARPVSRGHYLVGKVLPPVLLVLVVSLGPALLLALLRMALAFEGGPIVPALLLPLRAIAFGLIEAAALALPVVALSSLAKSRAAVQGGFATLFLLPWIVGGIFVGVARSPWPSLLSIPSHLRVVGMALFGIPAPEDDRLLPWWVSAIALTALVAGALAILRARVAKMEDVSA
jgi:ABC-type transport system involved in multi-copper enzyme maturation permease subunit